MCCITAREMAGYTFFSDISHTEISNTEIMGALGPLEWMIIILVLVLLFGARKIPGLARGIGQGIFEFRKAMKDDKQKRPEVDEDQNGKKEPGKSDTGK